MSLLSVYLTVLPSSREGKCRTGLAFYKVYTFLLDLNKLPTVNEIRKSGEEFRIVVGLELVELRI